MVGDAGVRAGGGDADVRAVRRLLARARAAAVRVDASQVKTSQSTHHRISAHSGR